MTGRKVIPVALTLAALGICAESALAQAERSYLLLCKGGNNTMELHSLSYPDFRRENLAPGELPNLTDALQDAQTAGQTLTSVTVRFQRSQRAASAGLGAGHCAWADRGVRPNEPDVLKLSFPGTWVVVRDTTADGSRAKGSLARDNVRYEAKGDSEQARKLATLLDAIRNGRDFQVQAYNDGDGRLVVTRFGP